MTLNILYMQNIKGVNAFIICHQIQPSLDF
jgi:hypothetical protein